MPPISQCPDWVRKVGVGRVEWKRQWARVPELLRLKTPLKPPKYGWVYDLVLTARIGNYTITYLRTSPEDLRAIQFPASVMAEIIASYAEFILNISDQLPNYAAFFPVVGEATNAKLLERWTLGQPGPKI